MTEVLHRLWWCLVICLAPLLLPLALWARRRTLRLAEASGCREGVCAGAGAPLRVLLMGESTVAGVGVACQQQALSGQLAEALAAGWQRPVQWRACGESGITAQDACERLLPEALAWPADIVVLVFGVNDCTHVTPPQRWRSALRQLSGALAANGAELVFSGVPPVQDFPALPWLLRQVLGLRAALLDRVLRQVAGERAAVYCPLGVHFAGESLAVDGYHPSALGYQQWAEALARCIMARTPRE